MKKRFVFMLSVLFLQMIQAQNLNKMKNIVKNGKDELFTTIYENKGKETVILLHGGPGFPSDMEEVANALKSQYCVISFHQRGTKKSHCATDDYSMKAYISDINAVADFYGVKKFHLWGHSWGGLYAQIYADVYSDRLMSLFLCCPGSGTGSQWKQTEKEVMQLNRSKTTFWQWSKMGMNNLLGILGNDTAYKRLFKQVMKNYNDEFVKTDQLTIDFSNLKARAINKTRKEILKYPELKPITNAPYKITIVYGDKDIYQSSKNFVLNRYPTASVFELKNTGHIPWLHNPTDYFKVLENHFQ